MKHIFKSDEIKALGFTWPHPDVPGQYLVTDENGLIDLKESIQSLKRQIFSDEKIVSDAFSFRSTYGGQMSVLEYSDFKDSYDVNRERLSRCKGHFISWRQFLTKQINKITCLLSIMWCPLFDENNVRIS